MTTLLGMLGWCAAAALAGELWRRARLVADAEHELRGPLTAISLGLEALRRQPVARRRAAALLTELGRADAALADVHAARRGRRAAPRRAPVRLDELLAESAEAWRGAAERVGGRVRFHMPVRAVVDADRRRLSQAFGNLLANAVEHGGGDIVITGTRDGDRVRVEIVDGGGRERAPGSPGRDRGRGLVIAERAVADGGGAVHTAERPGGGRLATVELPAEPAR